MTTHISVGLDNSTDGYQCGQQAARQASAILSNEVALAMLFTSHPDPDRVLQGVNNILGDVPLIGATSAGEYTQDGYVEGGAGIILIQNEDAQFHPIAPQRKWFNRSRRLLGKLSGLSSTGLGSKFNHRALMLFPDDQSMNLDGVVERAMTETGMLYDILGGPGLTHPAPPRPPAVFHNKRMIRAGLTGVEILSRTPLGMAIANGWQPISGPYRVTQADDRRIITIDGRPAQEVYEDFLFEHGLQLTSDTISDILLTYPIGICQEDDCKVSVLKNFDNHGALLMTSPPPTNSLIHILSTQPDHMVTAAERAIQQAGERLHDTRPAGLLFIDCMSTALVLGEAHDQQRTAVERHAGNVPFLGFRSHGVLARLQGQMAGHYECSVATCLIPE